MKSFLITLISLFYVVLAHAQGVVGNGGNSKNFISYLLSNKDVSTPSQLFFTIEPHYRSSLSELTLAEGEYQNCKEFFQSAYRAWHSTGKEFIDQESDQFHLLSFSSRFPNDENEPMRRYWRAFLLLEFHQLCVPEHYQEGVIRDQRGESYLAVNFPKKLKIVHDSHLAFVSAAYTCAMLSPMDVMKDNICPQVFRESFAIHEILSLFFPNLERSERYKVSAQHFYRYIRKK